MICCSARPLSARHATADTCSERPHSSTPRSRYHARGGISLLPQCGSLVKNRYAAANESIRGVAGAPLASQVEFTHVLSRRFLTSSELCSTISPGCTHDRPPPGTESATITMADPSARVSSLPCARPAPRRAGAGSPVGVRLMPAPELVPGRRTLR